MHVTTEEPVNGSS